MQENQKKKWNTSIILSLLIHVAILISLVIKEHHKNQLKEEAVEIEWVNIEDLPTELNKKAQIVQQEDKSINEKAPEKDYKLSKNNQDIKQETRAKKNGEFKNRKNKVEAPSTKSQPQPQPQPQVAANKKQNLLNALKPNLYNSQYSAAKLAPPPKPALSGAEVSQNDDYLKDVVVGAETLLKTREFVYYSYYNRIKRKLRQHWEPRIKKKIVKILKKGRRIASHNDKITRLVITLDKTGKLKRIQVKNASGYNDLDDAAIEAFRAAAPFPNPPNGIVSSSGEVEIPWDFVLET